jgi:MFS transporter, LPLT family, lysophospholipid transporter
VIPLGMAMGVFVIVMNFVHQVWLAVGVMIAIGAMAGFFVVPMNALLQHRGHHLIGAGRSIAVQNFNENASILVMIALYSLLLNVGHSIYIVIIVFGSFVASAMGLVQLWFSRSRRVHAQEIDRLLAFARAEDPHPRRRSR